MKKQTNSHTTELRGVIFALDIGREAEYAVNGSAFMMPLVDKSVIQQVIESVVRCGVNHIDIIVAADVDAVQSIVNEGLRWGIRVEVHRPVDVQRPYSILRRVAAECRSAASRILLVHADRFSPELPQQSLLACSGTVAFTYEGEWTGTAILQQADLADHYKLNTGRSVFGDSIVNRADLSGTLVEVPRPILLNSGSEYLQSQRRIMNNEFPVLLEQLRTAEPGVWIGRNTRLHPTAKLVAPVFVGANCDISAGVKLRPNAVVEDNCFMDNKVTAASCLVLTSSSVGEGLDLTDAIVCGRRVYNARINAAIDICDDVLVGDLRSGNFGRLVSSLCSRATAVMLMSVLWLPTFCMLKLISCLRGQLTACTLEFVRTPTATNHFMWRTATLSSWTDSRNESSPRWAMWRDLFQRVIPGLPAVARGQLRLVGVSPRTAAELDSLPRQWRDLLVSAHTGLISESLLQFGPYTPSDPCCVADLWHTSKKRPLSRLMLLLRYGKVLAMGPRDFIPSGVFKPSRKMGQTETTSLSSDVADRANQALGGV